MNRWIASLLVLFATSSFLCSASAETQAISKPELLLVYWSSKDCRWCSYWESSWSGMEGSLKNSEEFKRLTYRAIKNERLADPYTIEDFPPDVKWLKERIDRGEEKSLGRPGWGFYVNRVRIAKFYGTKEWDTKILPEIKLLVAKYAADAHPIITPVLRDEAAQHR